MIILILFRIASLSITVLHGRKQNFSGKGKLQHYQLNSSSWWIKAVWKRPKRDSEGHFSKTIASSRISYDSQVISFECFIILKKFSHVGKI